MRTALPMRSTADGRVPMAEPPRPAADGEEAERRLHPASWLFVLLRHLRQLIVPLLALLVFGAADRNELWSLVALCLVAAWSIWEYYTCRIRIGADSLLIRSGVLRRSLRQIPFARIQNVALHRNPLHRLFAVAEVRLESAGGIKPEAELRVLRMEDALALEALVRRARGRANAQAGAGTARMSSAGERDSAHATARAMTGQDAASRSVAVQGGVGQGKAGQGGAGKSTDIAVAPEAAGRLLLALPLREVLRLGLISPRGLWLVAGVFAVLSQLSQQAVEAVLRGWLRAVSGFVLGYGRGQEVLALVLVMLAFVLTLQAVSVLLNLLHYAGFRLERHGRRLTVERGLLTRLRTSSPYRRIQTFTLREGLLHRLFGRRTLEVSTSVLDNGSSSQPRSIRELAPLADAATCDALVRRLLPAGAQWPPPRWRPLHRLAWLRLLLPQLGWWSPVAAAAWAWGGGDALLLSMLWLPCALALSLIRARFAGYALDGRCVAVRDGALRRHWRVAEIGKLQGLRLGRGPLDHLFGTCSLLLDTAGGVGPGAPLVLRCLPAAEGQALCARLGRAVARRRLEG